VCCETRPQVTLGNCEAYECGRMPFISLSHLRYEVLRPSYVVSFETVTSRMECQTGRRVVSQSHFSRRSSSPHVSASNWPWKPFPALEGCWQPGVTLFGRPQINHV
jgi:hypothetical protein